MGDMTTELSPKADRFPDYYHTPFALSDYPGYNIKKENMGWAELVVLSMRWGISRLCQLGVQGDTDEPY